MAGTGCSNPDERSFPEILKSRPGVLAFPVSGDCGTRRDDRGVLEGAGIGEAGPSSHPGLSRVRITGMTVPSRLCL